MGWMSATVSTSMSFFISSSLISSVSARIDTIQEHFKCMFKTLLPGGLWRGQLTLHDHIGIGDGGEASVKRVDLSGSKKSLKNSKTQKQFSKCSSFSITDTFVA